MVLCSLVPNSFFSTVHQVRDLGQGAYSRVELVSDDSHFYAIKHQYYSEKRRGISQPALIEADTLVRLRNTPHFVNLIGICVEYPILSLIMEPLDLSLHQLIYDYHMGPISRKLYFPKLLRDMVSAMAALEQINVNHYDIKPGNILISWPNTDLAPDFKLSDFGISKSGLTSIQKEVVTYPYRPPELLVSKRYYKLEESKIDVWSLGVTLAEYLDAGPLWYEDDNILEGIRIATGSGASFYSQVEQGTVFGEYPIADRIGVSGLSPVDAQVLISMFRLNPRDRPSPNELAAKLSIRVVLPVLSPDGPHQGNSGISEILSRADLSGPWFWNKLAGLIIGIEILSRYTGEMSLEYSAAAYRIGMVYVWDGPDTEYFAELFKVLTARIIDAEIKLLNQIGFEVFNPRLTEKIIKLSGYPPEEILNFLRTRPREYFSQPVENWFVEL